MCDPTRLILYYNKQRILLVRFPISNNHFLQLLKLRVGIKGVLRI